MMTGDVKLLLVEDDADLGSVLKRFLEMNGFQVTLCRDGAQVLPMNRNDTFDLIILDVMLPGMDGFTVAEQIRQEDRSISIIFLTVKNTLQDKLKGLKLEADDYITKPFDPDELLLRIKNILKRSKILISTYQLGAYTFIPEALKLLYKKEEIALTSHECQLLQLLLDRKDQILKRQDILEKIWGENDYFLGRSLDVFISRLRKLLVHDQSISIDNVRGVGFKLQVKRE